MTCIISVNRADKLNIFASQKYSKKIHDKMNPQLLKHKEFKQDEDKKLWKSYVQFPGVQMVTDLIHNLTFKNSFKNFLFFPRKVIISLQNLTWNSYKKLNVWRKSYKIVTKITLRWITSCELN